MTEIGEIKLTISPRWWLRPALVLAFIACSLRLISWERAARFLANYAFRFGGVN